MHILCGLECEWVPVGAAGDVAVDTQAAHVAARRRTHRTTRTNRPARTPRSTTTTPRPHTWVSVVEMAYLSSPHTPSTRDSGSDNIT